MVSERAPTQIPLGVSLRAGRTFENYVVGPNVEAVALLRAGVAGQGERVTYLWGDAGCGKSHLLQASCDHGSEEARRVAYVPLRDYTRFTPAALEGFARVAILCLDDVDAVAGDEAWEEALFHLHNRAEEAGARLIVSASQPPAASGIELPDLMSRLAAGLVLRLKALPDEDRSAAFVLRARERGFEVPDEVASYVMKRQPRGMHALFDLLDELDRSTLEAKRRLTVPFLKSVLLKRDL